ncbi:MULTISPECIES: hypothetical protein [unclassified Streptomyces]|uniref:hypothetical protein n=1 Tax=unclassified Streptomyces TaxID=2593676 RepID=UPI002E18AADC
MIEDRMRVASGAAYGRWLTTGKDGRLSLYTLAEGGLLRWTESAVGGPDWDGPHFVPVPGLTHLTVVQGADGYVHFLGRRERAGADGAPSVDLVHAIQYQTGLAFTDWRSLGNPHEDREQGRRVAPPAGAAAQDGTVHVFVRGAHGGLMVRREAPSGKWRAWEDLGGGGLDARPAPIALSDGRIAVVSAAETGVFVWEQLQPGGDFTVPRGFGLHPVPGTLSAVETRPGRPTFFWADDAGATAAAWRAGSWPLPLGGGSARGAYAVLRAPVDGFDCVVLAGRGPDGGAVLGLGGTENEAGGFWWYSLDRPCQGAPALARDGHGRVVVALLGLDGLPVTARQDGVGLALSPWRQM